MASGRMLCTGTVDDIKKQAGADRLEDAFIRLVKGGMAK
jgi:hypothetical protein